MKARTRDLKNTQTHIFSLFNMLNIEKVKIAKHRIKLVNRLNKVSLFFSLCVFSLVVGNKK